MFQTKHVLFFKKAFILFALLFSLPSFSQLYNFKKYNTKNGLANSSVNCITQDRTGYLWFGTQGGGLSRFDGKEFKNYTKTDGLTSNDISWLCEDKKNNLWISTTEGLSFFDGDSFKNYDSTDGFSKETVYNSYCDSYGDVWIPTSANGLKIFRNNNFITIDSSNGLQTNFIFCVHEKGGEYWVGTYKKGLFVLDRNGKVKRHYSDLAGNTTTSVFAITEGSDGTLYLATTNAGVYSFKKEKFDQIRVEGTEKDFIGSIVADKRNNIWAATQHGLIKISAEENKLYNAYAGLSSEVVNGLCVDYEGNIWIGTSGGGVDLLKRESIVSYSVRDGLPNNIICTMNRTDDGTFFAGALHGGLNFFDSASEKFKLATADKDFESTTVSSVVELSGNLVLAASEEKGLLLFERTAGKFKLIKGISHYKTENDETDITVVLKIVKDGFGHVWACSFGEGLFMLDLKGNILKHFSKVKDGLLNNDIVTIGVDLDGNLLVSCNKEGVQVYKDGKFILFDKILPDITKITWATDIDKESGNIYLATQDGGLVIWNKGKVTNLNTSDGLCSNYIQSVAVSKGCVWIGTDKGVNRIKLNSANAITELRYFGTEDGFISPEINLNGLLVEKNGDVWFGSADGLVKYVEKFDYPNIVPPKLILADIKLFFEPVNWSDYSDKVNAKTNIPVGLILPYDKNHLTFNFRALTTEKVQYKFYLEGLDKGWFPFSSDDQAVYANIPPGSYTFRVVAKNSFGVEGKEAISFSFAVSPPFWKTWWFRISLGLLILGVVVFYIKWRERSLKKRQKQLEQTVEERTIEVVKQKVIAENQKHIIEEKHKEITDSINYAERIQRSFLATKQLLDENLKDYFVFFQPKDVVSGDFYWADKLSNGNFVLVTADSTGHGVPGAIMSILNISSLEKAVEQGLLEPSDIFNHTRKTIVERLKKDGSEEGGKDGMDASLICFDFKNSTLTYAAANNPVWIVRENQLMEFDPDKMPVGKHDRDSVSFTQHNIGLQKGDVVYVLTDGMPDQFGGPKGKKFMYKKLKEFLISISSESMEIQKQKLKDIFENWKGDLEQVDDVTLIGIRI